MIFQNKKREMWNKREPKPVVNLEWEDEKEGKISDEIER